MASSMRNTCVEQWRLCELTNILDSIEDDIASAISDKQIKTGNDYCNIVLRAMGKAIVSMREIIIQTGHCLFQEISMNNLSY